MCMDMVGCDVHMYTQACVCSMFGLYATVDVTALVLQYMCVRVHVHVHICMCTSTYMTCVYVRLCVCAAVATLYVVVCVCVFGKCMTK